MVNYSGKDGSVLIGGSTVAHITSWSFNPTSNNPSWASSSTFGFKTRLAGVQDGSGSMEGKLTSWALPFQMPGEVGDKVVLILRVVTGVDFTVRAIIDSITYNVDVDDGDVVSWSADFSLSDDNGGESGTVANFGWDNIT